MIEVQRSNNDFTLLAEMGMLDRLGPISSNESSDDDMQFTMRRFISKNNVSPLSSNSFPSNLGSTSPNVPRVFYNNHCQFLSKLVKVIKIHNLHIAYRTRPSSGRNSNCRLGPQGSSQLVSQGFILILSVQPCMVGNIVVSFTRYLEFLGKGMKMLNNIGTCVRPSRELAKLHMP